MPYSSSNMSLMRFAFTGSPTSSGTMCVTEGMTGSPASANRSEEHTSELQSLMRISYAVFCLKKKNQQTKPHNTNILTPHNTHHSDQTPKYIIPSHHTH